MSEMDVSTWKLFRLGDLFEVCKGTRLTKANMRTGNVLFIGSSAENNGVTAYISNDSHIHNGHAITVCYNGSVGETFYQSEAFWASDDVNVLRPRVNVSMMSMLFMTAIIKQMGRRYNYVNKWRLDKMINDKISLPATPDGDPDWAYMESYMKSVMEREEMFAEHLASLTAEAVADGHEIDVSGWGEFAFRDLGFKNYHGTRLNKCDRIDGNLVFVTAGKENQGVTSHIGNDVQIYTDAISIDMFGNCFYHKGNCAGDDNIYFFVNADVSELCKLFLTSCIDNRLRDDYSYAHQFRQTDADTISIKLPMTPAGDPDWAYMEQFMQNQMDKSRELVEHLDAIWN